MIRTIRRLIVVCALTGLIQPSLAQDDPDFESMPEGSGKDFVYLVCSDCHSMNHVLQKRYSRAGWRGTLKRMTIDFGMAELDKDETALVLDYLTQASKND